jgi:hypothetical protein
MLVVGCSHFALGDALCEWDPCVADTASGAGRLSTGAFTSENEALQNEPFPRIGIYCLIEHVARFERVYHLTERHNTVIGQHDGEAEGVRWAVVGCGVVRGGQGWEVR